MMTSVKRGAAHGIYWGALWMLSVACGLTSTAYAHNSRWVVSEAESTATCYSENNLRAVTINGLAPRDPTDFPPPELSRQMFVSTASSHGVLFELYRGTTTLRYYRGCTLAWSSQVAGHELAGAVLIIPRYGIMASYASLAQRYDDDEAPRPGILLFTTHRGIQLKFADAYDAFLLANISYHMTNNGRYAWAWFNGEFHFFAFEHAKHFSYRPGANEYVRDAHITERGKASVYRIQKVVFPDGQEIDGAEYERNSMQIRQRIGSEIYDRRREVFELAYERNL